MKDGPQSVGPINDPDSIVGQLADIGHTFLRMLGVNPFGPENPSSYQTAKMPPSPYGNVPKYLTMPREQGGVVPFGKLPATLEDTIPLLNKELESVGRLGFDTLGEARAAIRSEPEWHKLWDVEGHPIQALGEHYKKLVNNRIAMEKLGLASEQYTRPTNRELLTELMRSGMQPKPVPPVPPKSNLIMFPKMDK